MADAYWIRSLSATYTKFVRSSSRSKSLHIRYRISKIQNLPDALAKPLPHQVLQLYHPCYHRLCFFQQTTLDGVSWLAGGGYSYFGLYIHGVRYTKADGSILHGTYLPVIFENLTDTILSGREDVGYPKLYSDLDVNRSPDSYSLKASWRGAQFAEMELQGLQDSEEAPR